MATILQMLALSPTMESGAINQWHFAEGDAVEAGDILCEVETDKAAMDYECTASGVLLKILGAAGSELAVGAAIAIVGDEGEDIAELIEQAEKLTANSIGSAPQSVDTPATEAPPPTATSPTPTAKPVAPGAQRRVSPYAAQLAAERGVDLSRINGSGPEGRIIARDIEQAPPATPSTTSIPPSTIAAGHDIPLSKNRQILAARLTQSKQSTPHFYVTNQILMDALLEGRRHMNARLAADGVKIGVNEFFIKACAMALARRPRVNASFMGDRIVEHAAINVGLAITQGEGEGLVVPVIENADTKSLREINAELGELVVRARDNKLRPEDYETGTFTISNLGMYDVGDFTAIINPPQSAILAVSATKPTPVVNEDGRVVARQAMNATLACDHRTVDGVLGALFLQDLKTFLEAPLAMTL